jgi:pyruvate,orthophosphate dikinase
MTTPTRQTAEFTSKALEANFEQTASTVEISPRYAPLREAVARFQGLSARLEHLLYEISHPFRNWQLIISELRPFVLKNFNHYLSHEQGPECFALFSGIFLDALRESRKNSKVTALTVEALLAFADKVISSLKPETLPLYGQQLNDFFEQLARLDEIDSSLMMQMVQGHHPIKKMAAQLLSLGCTTDFSCIPAARLLQKILITNYEYWLSEEDPQPWFEQHCGGFCDKWEAGPEMTAISHAQMRGHLRVLEQINLEEDPQQALSRLLELPAHVDIVRFYREIPGKLGEGIEGGDTFYMENRKLLFLFRIMDTSGLSLIHEESLREINRSLVQLIRKQNFDEIEQFFTTAFQLLKANVRKYPHTSLQCIQVIGGEVFKRGNSRLVEAFLFEAVRFGFQYANVMGVDEDWQPISNPAHLANIRVWLNLIMQEPKWCSTLFSALIINIRLSGTCVKDTDLFQRDITQLLNHPIGPIYNLAKQFSKLMPVFFNEIGAEGELRDVSTELDEMHKRRDVLIHFLRKQSHVESSNLIVGFIRAIFLFWLTLDRKPLHAYLPEEILSQVTSSGPFVDELHVLARRLREELEWTSIDELLTWDRTERHAWLERQKDISADERRRFDLLVRMFRLLNHKYSLGMEELREQLQQAARSGFPEMEHLLESLAQDEPCSCLDALLTHLEQLKEIILSEQKFAPKEEIYYKRHIAVDIPSVYGRYSERKFDALGLAFRLENLANIYLERLSRSINLGFITQATFIRISEALHLYLRALKVDGISSRRLDTYASLLASSISMKRFTYTQHLDIMRGLSEGVKDVIYAYYTNIHQNNLSIIIPQIGRENLLIKFRPLWDEEDMPSTVHRLSEAFFRDLIATTFGLQHLDNFITKIIQTLEAQKDILDEQTLDLLMTYNPEQAISLLYNENLRTHNLIHLGNKGFNLMLLANDGKPVPPAFIITTEIFRCWQAVQRFTKAKEEFMQRVRTSITALEERTGCGFGSPENPLLLSVRSGAAISMPGMMTTVHNVGLNEDLLEELRTRNPDQEYFLWDTYRRFLQSWAMGEDMARDEFGALMNAHKQRYNVKLKRQFTPAQMRELALEYRNAMRRYGHNAPEDPWLQLVGAVEMVLESWSTNKARQYRHLMDVSDDWGTAVIVQTMVYGNRNFQAGSGVLFTAHPYRKVRRVALWGDYAAGDQGEDIVSGLVTSYPISLEQAELDGRPAEDTLERRFPAIYERLLSISRDLVYTKGWNPQEIEFTFEGPEPEQLHILQTRDMITIKKKEHFRVFVESAGQQEAVLGKGIGVSGSALSGLAVFTDENIRQLRQEQADMPLILIRQDTVPEDIKEISLADGLLTARGGQTSHASVVATRLEKTCVVGCRDLQVFEGEEHALISGFTIRFRDPVSIDGRSGLLLRGIHPVRDEVHILPL